MGDKIHGLNYKGFKSRDVKIKLKGKRYFLFAVMLTWVEYHLSKFGGSLKMGS